MENAYNRHQDTVGALTDPWTFIVVGENALLTLN